MLYMAWMYISSGPDVADKWLDGYVIELVLSMDTWLLAPGSWDRSACVSIALAEVMDQMGMIVDT